MMVGAIRKRKSIKGHLRLKQIDVRLIKSRHNELVREMANREYNHKSPLILSDNDHQHLLDKGSVDPKANLEDLRNRCEECRKLQE